MSIGSPEYLVLVGVIFVFSIVQSLFGVGLLVFGTPTLLLMGYPFEVALSYLLPSSIAISVIQTVQGWKHITLFRKNVPMLVLPFVAVGLASVMFIGVANLNILVGTMLIVTAAIRLSSKLNAVSASISKKHFKSGLIVTGLIHGMTNLGGAPLTIITNNIYSDKASIRSNIAFAYLLMAVTQIMILFTMRGATFGASFVILPAVAATTYATVGQRAFRVSSEPVYHHLMTAFVLLFGICLVVS